MENEKTFKFEALDEKAKSQKGEIQALNTEDAVIKIRKRGWFPTSIRPAGKPKKKQKTTFDYSSQIEIKSRKDIRSLT